MSGDDGCAAAGMDAGSGLGDAVEAASPGALVRAGVSAGSGVVTVDRWTDLRRHTPARIALGRAGDSLPTTEVLRLGVAHAQARDAVWLPLGADAVEADLRRAGFATLRAESAAPDRATYLLRPDLGRRLSGRAKAALREAQEQTQQSTGARAGAARQPFDLLLVLADGLSSLGVARHGAALAEAIRSALPAGWTLGPVVVATQSRVALGDAIADALGARMVAVLIGERPGLSSPDSVGVYLTWAPRPGRTTDAERNCVSNVRPEGLSVKHAARKVAWLCTEARRIGATGVALKDRSDEVAIEA